MANLNGTVEISRCVLRCKLYVHRNRYNPDYPCLVAECVKAFEGRRSNPEMLDAFRY